MTCIATGTFNASWFRPYSEKVMTFSELALNSDQALRELARWRTRIVARSALHRDSHREVTRPDLPLFPLVNPSRVQRIRRTLRAKAEENVGHYLDIQRRCHFPECVPMDISDRGKAERWLGAVHAVWRTHRKLSRIRLLRAIARKVHAASSGIAAGYTEFKSHGGRSRKDDSVESGQVDRWTAGCKRESDPGVADIDRSWLGGQGSVRARGRRRRNPPCCR